MKYGEMTKFMNDNGILVMQPVVANIVDALLPLEHEMSEEEYEKICDCVFNTYVELLDTDVDVDIWDLAKDELYERGYE